MRIETPAFTRLLLYIFSLHILMAQLLHEAGHWAVMQVYGRQPLWGFTSLVQLSDRTPTNPTDWVETTSLDGSTIWLHLISLPTSDREWLLFLVAGPAIQLIAIVIGFALANYSQNQTVRTFAFLVAMINAFLGFLYQIVNMLQGIGGDERLIAHYLGVSPVLISSTLAIAFGLSLLMGWRAIKTWKMRLIWGVALTLGVLPVGPVLMQANRIIIEQVDVGNDLYRSVFGFSFPVFLTGVALFLLIGFMAYKMNHALHRD